MYVRQGTDCTLAPHTQQLHKKCLNLIAAPMIPPPEASAALSTPSLPQNLPPTDPRDKCHPTHGTLGAWPTPQKRFVLLKAVLVRCAVVHPSGACRSHTQA